MRLSAGQIKAIKQEAMHCIGAGAELRLSGSRVKRQRGFTLVELVTVIVIVGIMAVAAMPRMFDRNAFDSRGYYDQVISTLRFAQKLAIAQRRFICVAYSASSVTLTYDATMPDPIAHAAATCPGSALTSPAGVTPFKVSAPTTSVTLSGYTDFNFSALGSPSASQVIAVSGYATNITVEAVTGYVH